MELESKEPPRPWIGYWPDALSLLADIENAARREDLPFVISAVELIRDAIERGII
jgi:hypothetical protein